VATLAISDFKVAKLAMRSLMKLAKKNCASCVKDIFSRFGFYEVWLAQSVGGKSKFLSLLKQRVNDNLYKE